MVGDLKLIDAAWLDAEIAAAEAEMDRCNAAGDEASIRPHVRAHARRKALAEVRARLAETPGWRPTHRHKKRGSEYELVGIAKAQVTARGRNYRMLYENDQVAVYRAHDGKLWCRFRDEFEDGRFEALPSPPADEDRGDAQEVG